MGASRLVDDLQRVVDNRQVDEHSGLPLPDSMARSTDLLQGTLDLLILKVLALGPLHGWGLSQRLHRISGDTFRVTQGSLYPSLHRLEGNGLLDATWELSETARRVKS